MAEDVCAARPEAAEGELLAVLLEIKVEDNRMESSAEGGGDVCVNRGADDFVSKIKDATAVVEEDVFHRSEGKGEGEVGGGDGEDGLGDEA